MKLNNLFEADAAPRRWPRVQGRETPLSTEMIKWLKKFDTTNTAEGVYEGKYFWQNEKGELCVYQSLGVNINRLKDTDLPLPFKFGEFPGIFAFGKNTAVTDLSFLPKEIGTLTFNDADIFSLKNIHKYVDTVKNFYVGSQATSGFLDLLRVKHIGMLYYFDSTWAKPRKDEDARKAFKIVQKCHRSNIDIFECQEMLVDAGYERFC